MDLLGSILGSMTGPPKVSAEEQEKRKKAREMAMKMEEKQREATKNFRQKMEKKISEFTTSDLKRISLTPMTIVERQVVHDIAEIAGLVAHSFGEEGVDRHVELWKKEATPCEDELAFLRQGRDWDPAEAAKEKEERLQRQKEDEVTARSKKNQFVPKSNYKEKYTHLIGTDADLAEVRKTEPNKSFGMVSAESKKDKRSVEDIQNDIRAKKMKKMNSETAANGGIGESST